MNESNDGLEREIERLLAVAPSPSFRAGIHKRIARTATPRRSPIWILAGTGALVAAILFAMRIPQHRPFETVAPLVSPSNEVPAVVAAPVAVRAPARRTARATPNTAGFFSGQPEQSAIRKVIADAANRGVDLSPLITQPSGAIAPPSEIRLSPIPDLAPLTVEPLKGDAREGTNP